MVISMSNGETSSTKKLQQRKSLTEHLISAW